METRRQQWQCVKLHHAAAGASEAQSSTPCCQHPARRSKGCPSSLLPFPAWSGHTAQWQQLPKHKMSPVPTQAQHGGMGTWCPPGRGAATSSTWSWHHQLNLALASTCFKGLLVDRNPEKNQLNPPRLARLQQGIAGPELCLLPAPASLQPRAALHPGGG